MATDFSSYNWEKRGPIETKSDFLYKEIDYSCYYITFSRHIQSHISSDSVYKFR